MFDFKKLHVDNTPVFFQKLPSVVNPVCLSWTVFVGSADDGYVGQPGLYHWFEHVPFRGTKRYPDGNRQIDEFLGRYGGGVNATTGHVTTSFDVQVPKRLWKTGLNMLTDLVAHPLLRPKDVEAERKIVQEENNEIHSSAAKHADDELFSVIWPGHPLAHSVGGKNSDIRKMDAGLLKKAHEWGYSDGRLAFFAAGDLLEKDLLRSVERALKKMPYRAISSRRETAYYGAIRWERGFHLIPTMFDSSVIFMLFPMPPRHQDLDRSARYFIAREMFFAGGVSSPIEKITRVDRNLVYAVHPYVATYADGGAWGFVTETSPGNESKVIKAFWDTIRSKEVRSKARYAYVKDSLRADIEMDVPHPARMVSAAQRAYAAHSKILSDKEWLDVVARWPKNRVNDVIDSMVPDNAKIVIFKGKGRKK